MPIQAQFGVAAESSYGTAVTPSRFYPILDGESLKPRSRRLPRNGKRAGMLVRRAGVPVAVDGGGSVPMEVGTKGHGLLLSHTLGAVATSGPTTSAYTHAFTLASLQGKSLTAQIGRELVGTSTLSPETYPGCKVLSAEWSLARDGVLTATYDFDSKFPTTATALASPSWPSPDDVFPWSNATLTIDGTNVEVESAKIAVARPAKVDRIFLNNAKKEPLANAHADVTWEFVCEFASLAQYNRVFGSTVASTVGAIVFTCTGLDLIGGSIYPSITFSIPAAQFNDISGPNVTDDGPIMTTVSGVGTWDLSAQPLTVTYVSADATP